MIKTKKLSQLAARSEKNDVKLTILAGGSKPRTQSGVIPGVDSSLPYPYNYTALLAPVSATALVNSMMEPANCADQSEVLSQPSEDPVLNRQRAKLLIYQATTLLEQLQLEEDQKISWILNDCASMIA